MVAKRLKERGAPDTALLEAEYGSIAAVAARLLEELSRQIAQLIGDARISLGFPIQGRVKGWPSLAEKLERKSLSIGSVRELPDLVGLRVILQFKRDLETVCSLIEENFEIVERQNAEERLREDQFGYTSVHYVIAVPTDWLRVPTLMGLGGLVAEVQVRTMAQHIWASASHTLQYKQEASVPIPIRRAISRVSALLETVDLEFERVLIEREAYREQVDLNSSDDQLNVDLLESVLDTFLPAENKSPLGEDYEGLLQDLLAFGITGLTALLDLFEKHIPKEYDTSEPPGAGPDPAGRINPRRVDGIPYYHAGFVRRGLRKRFGKRFEEYLDRINSD